MSQDDLEKSLQNSLDRGNAMLGREELVKKITKVISGAIFIVSIFSIILIGLMYRKYNALVTQESIHEQVLIKILKGDLPLNSNGQPLMPILIHDLKTLEAAYTATNPEPNKFQVDIPKNEQKDETKK